MADNPLSLPLLRKDGLEYVVIYSNKFGIHAYTEYEFPFAYNFYRRKGGSLTERQCKLLLNMNDWRHLLK